MALILGGDREAEKVFVDRHLDWASAYARRCHAGDLSEDVAQEAIMKLLARPPFDPRYSSIRPYLRVVIRKKSLSARFRKRLEPLSREARLVDPRTSPSQAVARAKQLSAANKAIARLPTPQRLVVRRRAEGLSYGEIARLTGRTEASERALHQRALTKLRRQLRRFLPP
ncbi:RNA polymerase sigma factor [Enhygromyxa salina]|uniref:RNA polymerase sigma factor n=1 Tax=Enhygromyxa salina TaxID=215803 RepID=UPI0013FD054A|nr:RNA polymerase sigma factor [Enhygromyxa salina]